MSVGYQYENCHCHPWCFDPARDEAVRASEDNRSGPLPTLDDCIARQTARPCGGTDPAPLGGEPGGAANGLRTERVTLEVTHHCRFPLKEWLVDMVADCTSDSGESVRVVDESAPAASDAAGKEPDAWGVRRNGMVDCVTHRLFRSMAERSAEQFGGTVIPLHAAPQAASDAAGTEPVAWMCEWTDYMSFYESKTQAERSVQGDVVVPQPLYRTPPQPAPGWLTGEEREAIMYLIANRSQFAPQTTHEERRNAASRVCHSLLARSTPPEVVAPKRLEDMRSVIVDQRDAEWIAALAAAGVTVKEVGK